MHADAEGPQELLGERPGGHSRRGLAGAGALQHVANVGMAELEQAGKVGVAGPRRVNLLDLGVHRPGVHPLLPVGVIAVRDQDGDWAAERSAMAHAGADLDRVALDLHPPAAPVTELAASHLAVEALAVELEARGKALDDRDQAGAVRLAGGCEAKRCHRAANPSGAASAAPAGARAYPWAARAKSESRCRAFRACSAACASAGARSIPCSLSL